MKAYSTVIFPLNLDNNEFWMGEVDSNGHITGFVDLALDSNLTIIDREDMFYYTTIHPRGDVLTVEPVQGYLAFTKDGVAGMSVVELIEKGLIDPVEVANDILDRHRLQRKN